MSKLTEYEEQLIINNYEYGDFDLLSKELGKSKHTISEWARRRGLKRKVCIKRVGSLYPLIDGSYQGYYWLGMYLADGYISKTGHFMLSQAIKDSHQVYKLAEFLGTKVYFIDRSNANGYPNGTDAYRVNISDKENGAIIRQMFNITHQKTYDKLSINFDINEDIARCLIIGFIDGDGSISEAGRCTCVFNCSSADCILHLAKSSNINIDNLKDWKSINGKEYAKLYINRVNMIQLKKFAHQFSLPINPRKWDRVIVNP